MSKDDDDFVIHERWDSHYANDGVMVDVVDEAGNDWGSFKIALFDGNVPRIRHAIERSERNSKRNAKARGGSKDQAANIATAVDLALDTFLLGWELKNRAGKPIPFTKEKVQAYFGRKGVDSATGETTYPVSFVLDRLFVMARDATNFQPDDQEADVTGN